jgi:hypothetical protein
MEVRASKRAAVRVKELGLDDRLTPGVVLSATDVINLKLTNEQRKTIFASVHAMENGRSHIVPTGGRPGQHDTPARFSTRSGPTTDACPTCAFSVCVWLGSGLATAMSKGMQVRASKSAAAMLKKLKLDDMLTPGVVLSATDVMSLKLTTEQRKTIFASVHAMEIGRSHIVPTGGRPGQHDTRA